jgi:IclR family transcriptional regulator, pca regulon regulatory protein
MCDRYSVFWDLFMTQDEPGDTSLTFQRGLDTLQLVLRHPLGLTIAEAATSLRTSRAAARRYLLTLDHAGFVRLSHRHFIPTPRIARLCSIAAQEQLWEHAGPVLSRVATMTGEASSLSVLEAENIVYVARAPGRHVLAVSVDVGSSLPAPFTSMGRVLLAGSSPRLQSQILSRLPKPPTQKAEASAAKLASILKTVSQQGYAMVEEELEPGLLALAVPVLGCDGSVLAAINISSTPGRTNCAKMTEDWLPILTAAAIELNSIFQTVRLKVETSEQ